MLPLHGFRFLLFFTYLVRLVSAGKCPPSIDCGELGNVNFPFTNTDHPDCGVLAIHGCDDPEPGAKKSIKNNNKWYDVVSLDQVTITVRDGDLHDLLLQRSCEVFSHNFTFTVSSPLASSHVKSQANLFRCGRTLNPRPPNSVSISDTCTNDTVYAISTTEESSGLDAFSSSPSYNDLKECPMVRLPVTDDYQGLQPDGPNDLFKYLTADIHIEIQLSHDCSSCRYVQEGQCRLGSNLKFYCDKGKTRKTVYIVAAVASAAGALGVLIVLAFCFRKRIFNKENPTHQIIETFLKDRGHLAAKRYSYSEVKKATNSFKNKLGQGGYGSVYKGKLHDGTLVAVKVLSDSKGNGEEFINEVASISVTSHVNIVSLLGFCLEGSKRALIYKYMPNGSVEKFIYEEKDLSKLNLQLSCKTIYNIAIGVARGLEYLHKGCNAKILHFDIKPHNILLDEDFRPKISDFGLAKVCPGKESFVSLLGARGTAGYIAPEVFSRNFGEVSHKSDVYSYGMMVLEMVGGRKNINVEVECSSEIYFPHWVYKHLELNQEPRLRCMKNETDKEMVRKMIIVSLWCIQTDPSHRPAMSKVVDMMEGSLESLQIPPKPYLSSPTRSPVGSSGHDTETYDS